MNRILSLDFFRGFTIAAMILVNNPGSWKYVYPPLLHAGWHGWTPTDLIFPFFLFIVGVSLSFSFSSKRDAGISRNLLITKIFRRTLVLFCLGMFLTLFPGFSFSTVRIPGVLQRIALCYFFVSLLFQATKTSHRVFLCALILLGYYALMKWIPVPGYGAGNWTFEGNLCGYVDAKLLAGHLYKPGFDPEGILSTVPAIATTLLGTIAGDLVRKVRGFWSQSVILLGLGILLLISGQLLHPLFPINKQLWTSTYVLLAGGAAFMFFGISIALIEGMGWKRWVKPFRIFGQNAIAVFVGSGLMAKILLRIKIMAGGEEVSLWNFIYSRLIVPWAGFQIGSLVFPVLLILLWLGILTPLYRRNIIVKV